VIAVVAAAGVWAADSWRSVATSEVPRIAVLTSHTATPYDQALAGVRQHFRQQGMEVAFDVYPLDGDRTKTARIVQDAKRSRVTVLLTLGTLATQSTLETGVELPVVGGLLVSAEDITKGANATGVSLEFPLDTQFQWIRKFLPAARTVGVLYNPGENQRRITAATQAAARSGLRLETYEVHAPRDIPPALESLGKRIDVLWTVVDSLILAPETAKDILLFSFRNRIPVVGLSPAWVRSGALYALEWDHTEMGAQCGEIVQKILQGARAGSIPVAAPRKVLYSVNQRIATHLKIDIPERLAREAREVF
jgi:putative ABC transport system substrate-binding protein